MRRSPPGNYDFFAALPRQRRGGFDLPKTFARVAGLEVEDYLGLGFGLLTHHITIGASLMATADIGMQRTYFDNANLRPGVRDAMWRLVSRPLDSYQTALQAEWDATTGAARWSAMRTFSEYPMIEMPDGTIVAVSRRLLRDRVTHGIYWVLANALKENNRQRFTNYFGEIFEEYVQRCFRRALGHGFRSRATYGHAKRPLVDGALATKRSLGLCECKVGACSSMFDKSGPRRSSCGLSASRSRKPPDSSQTRSRLASAGRFTVSRQDQEPSITR